MEREVSTNVLLRLNNSTSVGPKENFHFHSPVLLVLIHRLPKREKISWNSPPFSLLPFLPLPKYRVLVEKINLIPTHAKEK